VHVNATFADVALTASRLRKPAAHLHIATARVPLELVLWHVISEWGVTPKTSAWRELPVRNSARLQGFTRR
jgi:hypothetical protein